MNLTQKLSEAILLSKKWLKEAQNEDFGWPRIKSSPSHVNSTSEAINALIMLGEDSSSPQIRKGLLWLLENRGSWGNEQLRGKNNLLNVRRGLDDLCWALIGLSVSNNTYVRKVFSEKLELLLSRQVREVKENDETKYSGLFVEEESARKEKWGLYTSALALKIMSKCFYNHDERVKELIEGLKRHKAKDGGWPTELNMNPDLESDPCYTAIILDALMDAGESTNEKYILDALKFLENELKIRNCLWSEWVDEKFKKKDKKEQASTEATGQGLITLLKAGYELNNEAVKNAIKWLLSEDVFVWRGEDEGGFRLFPNGPIFNYSTYYGVLALKAVFDIEKWWEKFTKKYLINESELNFKTKASLNRLIMDMGIEMHKPITISRLQNAGLLNRTIKGKIKDEKTIERIWFVLETLEKEGPLTLAKLENLVREKSESLKGAKKSWTREMFIVLSRLHIQNLLILYKNEDKIREITFPETEAEYADLATKDVKIWSRFDFEHLNSYRFKS